MEELVYLSQQGDEKAFTKLILNIENDLYRIAKVRLSDDNDINDAIQETMIIAYNHLKKLKDPLKFKSWIIKILINECNKIYNKRIRINNLISKIVSKDIFYASDNSIQKSNSKLDFELVIKNLNYKEKIIVTLYYNSKYTYNEISEILNIKTNTVKSILRRAKQKIKKYCEEEKLYE